MTFEKEIAGCEKFFIAVNEQRPPFVIQLVLEGDGDPDGDSLFDALEATTAHNPGSSMRYEKVGNDERWVIGPPPTFTMVEAPEWTGNTGGESAPFLMWPMDAIEGPTCELLCVHGKTKNYLVFRALHAVMDGKGTIAWAQDFMRCLRGEEPIGHPSTVSVDQLLRDLKTDPRPIQPADALHPLGKSDAGRDKGFDWRRVIVDRPLDAAVAGRIAVAIAQMARAIEPGKVRINLPTDLRSYCPDERTTGNMFSSLYLDVLEDASPSMLGLKIVQMLYKNEGTKTLGLFSNNIAGSLAAHRVKVFWDLAHMHDTDRYSFSATLSHLGVLDGDTFSAPSFCATSAKFVPLVGDSGCVISLSGFDGTTVGCVGLVDRFLKDGQLDVMAENIRVAIAG